MRKGRRSIENRINKAIVESLEDRRLLANPVLADISDITMLGSIGGGQSYRTYQVPITATDADGDSLEYTFTSSDPTVIKPVVHENCTFIRFNISFTNSTTSTVETGALDFMLFDDWTPKTISVIKGFIQAGYYNGLSFHRIISDFMAQGGDPSGDGTGGPGFSFDDEFNKNLTFSNPGQLAMANSGNDTNGSQFFITDAAPYHLNFYHTIFGQLVRGQTLFNHLMDVNVDTNDAPTADATITSAQIIENTTDTVLTLQSLKPGTATITVTVTDNDPNGTPVATTFNVVSKGFLSGVTIADTNISNPTTETTFTISSGTSIKAGYQLRVGSTGEIMKVVSVSGNDITVQRAYSGTTAAAIANGDAIDAYRNTAAFLGHVGDFSTPVNQPVVINLTGTELDNDALSFGAQINDTVAHASILSTGNNQTLTIIPDPGYVGVINLLVGINRTISRSADIVYSTSSTFDTQVITITVGQGQIHAHEAGFSAVEDAEKTGLVATFTADDKDAYADQFAALINWGDGTNLTLGTIVQSDTVYHVYGTHTYAKPGDFPLSVKIVRGSGTDNAYSADSITQTGAVAVVEQLAAVAPAGASAVSISLGNDSYARKGKKFSQVGSFTFAGTFAGAASLKVNYGDGSATANLAFDSDRNFTLSHVYAINGNYTVTVSLYDGATKLAEKTLLVKTVSAPTLAATGNKSGMLYERRSLTLAPSSLSTVGADKYWFSINWGDGTTQVSTYGMTSYAHDYLKAGTFKVSIKIFDVYGNDCGTKTLTQTVSSILVKKDADNNKVNHLYVSGTNGKDNIAASINSKGQVIVNLNGKASKAYTINGYVYVFGLKGNDVIKAAPNFPFVFCAMGNEGNDTLTGGAGAEILVGNEGNDTIKCGSGTTIAIGGAGVDKITGGKGQNLIVGGATFFDNDPGYLMGLAAEWTNTTTAYATRVNHLTHANSGGRNNNIVLTNDYLYEDNAQDILTGGDGQDLFVVSKTGLKKAADKTDKKSNETLIDIKD